jgi:hypothetical protein
MCSACCHRCNPSPPSSSWAAPRTTGPDGSNYVIYVNLSAQTPLENACGHRRARRDQASTTPPVRPRTGRPRPPGGGGARAPTGAGPARAPSVRHLPPPPLAASLPQPRSVRRKGPPDLFASALSARDLRIPAPLTTIAQPTLPKPCMYRLRYRMRHAIRHSPCRPSPCPNWQKPPPSSEIP